MQTKLQATDSTKCVIHTSSHRETALSVKGINHRYNRRHQMYAIQITSHQQTSPKLCNTHCIILTTNIKACNTKSEISSDTTKLVQYK